MTGTYTGQFVMNGFLDIRLSLWLRIAVTRLIAILPTLVVALAYRNSQGTELDVLNEWLNVLNSVQLPFALVPVSLPETRPQSSSSSGLRCPMCLVTISTADVGLPQLSRGAHPPASFAGADNDCQQQDHGPGVCQLPLDHWRRVGSCAADHGHQPFSNL